VKFFLSIEGARTNLQSESNQHLTQSRLHTVAEMAILLLLYRSRAPSQYKCTMNIAFGTYQALVQDFFRVGILGAFPFFVLVPACPAGLLVPATHRKNDPDFGFLFDDVRRVVGFDFAVCAESLGFVLAPTLGWAVVVESVLTSVSEISPSGSIWSSTKSESESELVFSLSSSMGLFAQFDFACNITTSFSPVKMLQTGHLIIGESGRVGKLALEGSAIAGSSSIGRDIGVLLKGCDLVACPSEELEISVSIGSF
jgi:hypothetical protein